MKFAQRAGILVAMALMATACTSSAAPDSTTTSSLTPLTTSATASSGTVAPDESATTTQGLSALTPPEYAIVDRIQTDAPGDTVVVLLDTDSYTSLTDLDLYDIIAQVVDQYPPISVLHIVDDEMAVNTVANPDATDEEMALVKDNYLARLEDGFMITYLGPFATSGTAILGS